MPTLFRLSAGFFFVHLAKNSEPSKTEILEKLRPISVETQDFGFYSQRFTSIDFWKTQNFEKNPSIFRLKTQIFGQKLRFSAIFKLGIVQKVDKRKAWLYTRHSFFTLFRMKANLKTFKNLSLSKITWVFFRAYVVKQAENRAFSTWVFWKSAKTWVFFDLSFFGSGEKKACMRIFFLFFKTMERSLVSQLQWIL